MSLQQAPCHPPMELPSTGAAGISATDEQQQVSFGFDGALHIQHVSLGNKEEYLGSPFLPSEPDRLKALACCFQGPRLPQTFYDAVSKLVTTLFDMPIGTVVFIDQKHAVVQGAAGMKVAEPTIREYSICTWTLIPIKPEVLVVEDLTTDGRYSSHPVVCQPPHIRFYASVPLVTSTGFRLGTLCCLDFKPRCFSAECANMLCNLGELIMQEVEAQLPPPTSTLLYRANQRQRHAVLLMDLKVPGWKVLFGTELWPVAAMDSGSTDRKSTTGSTNTQLSCSLEGTAFWDAHVRIGAGVTNARPWHQYTNLVRRSQAFQLVVRSKQDTSKMLCLDMRPANTAKVWDEAVDVLVSSQGPLDDSSPNVRGLYFAVLLNRDLAPEQPASASEETQEDRSLTGTGTLRHSSISSEGSMEDSSTTALWQATPMSDVHIGPLLGHGAYGRVYLGKMGAEGTGSTIVAVKVIPHRHVDATRKPLRGASGAEGAMGLRLRHPYVIQTHKFVTVDHSSPSADVKASKRARTRERLVQRRFPGLGDGLHSWIVLEYCNRGTLQSVIDRGELRIGNSTWEGGPDMRAVLTVAHNVASAMAYLHKQGVLHGDLGPKNVLLVRDDTRTPPFVAKVSDFGLAQELAVDASLVTQTYGTVTHMPVELVCDGTLTAAADVYAFGVMLWELYTGRRPFAGLNPVQLVAQKLMGWLVLTFDVPTPEPYRALAEACMSKDPTHRPSFAKVVVELERLQTLVEQGLLQPGEFPVWDDPQKTKLNMARQLQEVGISI